MGSVLYELGYKGTLVDFQNSTTLQDAWFEAFTERRQINYTLDVIANHPPSRKFFALRYNGDAIGYADKLVHTMKANGIKVGE